jgi:hypothetical protein
MVSACVKFGAFIGRCGHMRSCEMIVSFALAEHHPRSLIRRCSRSSGFLQRYGEGLACSASGSGAGNHRVKATGMPVCGSPTEGPLLPAIACAYPRERVRGMPGNRHELVTVGRTHTMQTPPEDVWRIGDPERITSITPCCGPLPTRSGIPSATLDADAWQGRRRGGREEGEECRRAGRQKAWMVEGTQAGRQEGAKGSMQEGGNAGRLGSGEAGRGEGRNRGGQEVRKA